MTLPQTEPPALPPSSDIPGPAQEPRRPSFRKLTLLGLLGLVLIAALSGLAGYNAGIRARQQAEAVLVAQALDEQFQLGLQDMQVGRYDLARQRFEYIVNVKPDFPGITDKLADAILHTNSIATPTVQPTPTVTPTPDLRGVLELFTQAQQDLSNYEWSKAIETLLSLRKADPNYQAVWVDDMLYISFRNRGADKILKSGDLEGGIYDLTQASQFGLLDDEASSYLNWARLYITGASFWELDWAQAVYYFGQVAPALPNLRDGSGWTATERYRLALIGYSGYLADQGDCSAAVEQYEAALAFGEGPEIEQLYAKLYDACGGSDEGESSEEKPDEDNQEATEEPQPTEPPPTEPPPTEPPPAESTPTAGP